MQSEITFLQAWHDFYAWAVKTGLLASLPEIERKRIYQRNASAKGQRKYPLSNEKIKQTLTKYAPDRYRFEERVILIEP